MVRSTTFKRQDGIPGTLNAWLPLQKKAITKPMLAEYIETHSVPDNLIPVKVVKESSVDLQPAVTVFAKACPNVAAKVFHALCMRTLKATESKY